MIGWFGTPLGRVLQGILGIALLWVGTVQVTALGLLVMMTGLVAIVIAAAPPPFLPSARAVRARARPPSHS